MQFALAEKLGKTHKEIQEITIHEFQHWIAYYEISEENRNSGK
jgi:hypothetical protein|tara:strand:- start:1845 stop:1973 length:129 start_codon:yes stop_codon:yes gene_type:complete